MRFCFASITWMFTRIARPEIAQEFCQFLVAHVPYFVGVCIFHVWALPFPGSFARLPKIIKAAPTNTASITQSHVLPPSFSACFDRTGISIHASRPSIHRPLRSSHRCSMILSDSPKLLPHVNSGHMHNTRRMPHRSPPQPLFQHGPGFRCQRAATLRAEPNNKPHRIGFYCGIVSINLNRDSVSCTIKSKCFPAFVFLAAE